MEFESKWEKLWTTQPVTETNENNRVDGVSISEECVDILCGPPHPNGPVMTATSTSTEEKIIHTPSDNQVSKVFILPKATLTKEKL